MIILVQKSEITIAALLRLCCKVSPSVLPMKQFILKYSFLPLLVILTSCWKEPVYPDTPSIELNRLTGDFHYSEFSKVYLTTVTIGVNFKDGDGDLGLEEADTLGLYDPIDFDAVTNLPINKYYNNFFIETFIEKNGEFVPAVNEVVAGTQIVKDGRFILLSPDDKTRALEGELRYTFDVTFANLPLYFKSGDRLKFKIQIADRALNLSNIIETHPVQIFF
jgi:hypothetical protein